MKSKVILSKVEKMENVTIVHFEKNKEVYKVTLQDDDIILINKNGYEYETLQGEKSMLKCIVNHFEMDEKSFDFNEGSFENIDLVYKYLSEKLCVNMDKINMVDYRVSKEKTLISVNFECFVRYNDITSIEYEGVIWFSSLYSDEVYDSSIHEKRF